MKDTPDLYDMSSFLSIVPDHCQPARQWVEVRIVHRPWCCRPGSIANHIVDHRPGNAQCFPAQYGLAPSRSAERNFTAVAATGSSTSTEATIRASAFIAHPTPCFGAYWTIPGPTVSGSFRCTGVWSQAAPNHVCTPTQTISTTFAQTSDERTIDERELKKNCSRRSSRRVVRSSGLISDTIFEVFHMVRETGAMRIDNTGDIFRKQVSQLLIGGSGSCKTACGQDSIDRSGIRRSSTPDRNVNQSSLVSFACCQKPQRPSLDVSTPASQAMASMVVPTVPVLGKQPPAASMISLLRFSRACRGAGDTGPKCDMFVFDCLWISSSVTFDNLTGLQYTMRCIQYS